MGVMNASRKPQLVRILLSAALSSTLIAGPALALGPAKNASKLRSAANVEAARARLVKAVENYERILRFMPAREQAEFNASMAADYGDFDAAAELRKGASIRAYFFAWDVAMQSKLAAAAPAAATKFAWALGRGLPAELPMPPLESEAHAIGPVLVGVCVLLALGAFYVWHLLSADRHPTAIADANNFLTRHPNVVTDPGFPNLLNKEFSFDPDLSNFHLERDPSTGCDVLAVGGASGQGETVGYFDRATKSFVKEAPPACKAQ